MQVFIRVLNVLKGRSLAKKYVVPLILVTVALFCMPFVLINECHAKSTYSEQNEKRTNFIETIGGGELDYSSQMLAEGADETLIAQSLDDQSPKIESESEGMQDMPIVRRILGNSPVAKFLRPNSSLRSHEQPPMVAFRQWAKTPKPFLPSLALFIFVGILGNAFFASQIAVAQECCRSQFWRCLGRAILVGVMIGISQRILLLLEITVPLSVVIAGAVQLCLFAGLSVAITLIGERILKRTGLSQLPWMIDHPRVCMFLRIFVGSLLLAGIGQIPAVGKLPQIGIRLIMLLVILGAGGLLKTRFGTKPISVG